MTTLENLNMQLSLLNKQLEEATTKFFYAIEPFKEIFGEKQNLQEDNNLKHFSDNEWVAHKLEKFLAVSDVDINVILEYIKTSVFFEKEKYECEQNIIKWLITWILEGRTSWIAGEEYDEDFIIFHKSCDLGFHDGIINALVEAGMPLERALEGIEYYSDLWFEDYIYRAFNNRYDPVYMWSNPYYVAVDPYHRECWLKLRRFAYYHYHKPIMEKYGNITPDMKMSIEEAREMYRYVEEENKKRQEFLESIRDKFLSRFKDNNDSNIEEKKKTLIDKQ